MTLLHTRLLPTLLLLLSGWQQWACEAFGIPEFLELGFCGEVEVVPDFNPVRYQGVWYDMARLPNEYQAAQHCVTQNYTWQTDHFQVLVKGLTMADKKIKYSMSLHGTEGRPLPDMTAQGEGVPESPYQVIDTDYMGFSCVYSCTEYYGFKAAFAWILSRSPELNPEHTRRCHTKLSALGIQPSKIEDVRQGQACPYSKRNTVGQTTAATIPGITTSTTAATTIHQPPATSQVETRPSNHPTAKTGAGKQSLRVGENIEEEEENERRGEGVEFNEALAFHHCRYLIPPFFVVLALLVV